MSGIRSSKRKRAVDGDDATSTVTSKNQAALSNLNSTKARKKTLRKSIVPTEQDGIEVEQRVISLRSKEITTPLYKKLRRATKRTDDEDHDVSVATTITENEVLESDEEAWEGMDVESVSASDTEISTPAKRLYRRESSYAVPISARKSTCNRESDSIIANTQPTPLTRGGRRSTPFIQNAPTESRDDASQTTEATSVSRSSARLAFSARARSSNSSTALVAPQTRASTSRLSRWGRRAELAAVPNHERSAPQNAHTVPIHSLPQLGNNTSELGEAVDSASPIIRRPSVLIVLVLTVLIGYLWAAGGRGSLQSIVRKVNVPIQQPSIAVRMMESPTEGVSALELLIKQTYQELALHRNHINDATASAGAVQDAWNMANVSRTAKLQENADLQQGNHEVLLAAVRGLNLIQAQVATAKDAFETHITQEQAQLLQLEAQDVDLVNTADLVVNTQLLPNLTAATVEANHLYQVVSDELLKMSEGKTQLGSNIAWRNVSTTVSSPVSELVKEERLIGEMDSIVLRAAELFQIQLEEAREQQANSSLGAYGSGSAMVQQVEEVFDQLSSIQAVLSEQKLRYEQANLSYVAQQNVVASASLQLEAEKYALEQQNHSLVMNTTNLPQETSDVDLSSAQSEDIIKTAATPAQEQGFQRLRIEIEAAHTDGLNTESENLAQAMERALSEVLTESAHLDHQHLQRAASDRIPKEDLLAASSENLTDVNNMATVHDFALGARGGRAVHHRSLCPADGGVRLTSHPVGSAEDGFGSVATSVVAPFQSLLSALAGGKKHKRGELSIEPLPRNSKSKVSAASVSTVVSHSRPRHDVYYALPHEESAASPLSVAEDGKHGQVTVVLLVPISLTAIKLVHATPPDVASLPECAPRSVQLWGWTDDPTKVRHTAGRLIDLGAHYLSDPVVSSSYLIEANAETNLTGKVLEQGLQLAGDGIVSPIRAVTIQVLSNHGESSFSCIHRLQVLGTLEEQ